MILYNTFFIPGKVPSLNDLNAFRAIQGAKQTSIIRFKKKKKASSYQYNMYNEVKQKWSAAVVSVVNKKPFNVVESCYYSYLMIENTKKRDPSNICATAIKFVEDGLMKAGVIKNDGWDNVLGIIPYWHHDKIAKMGVCVFMASEPLSKHNAIHFWRQQIEQSGKESVSEQETCFYCGKLGVSLTMEEHELRWGKIQLCKKHVSNAKPWIPDAT